MVPTKVPSWEEQALNLISGFILHFILVERPRSDEYLFLQNYTLFIKYLKEHYEHFKMTITQCAIIFRFSA